MNEKNKIIRIEAEIGTQYSLFSTDDGEWYSGGGSYMIEDFAKESGQWLEKALIVLLGDNPNKILSLVIVSEGIDYDEAIIPKDSSDLKEAEG